jgi:hypothetical protein
VGELRWRRRSGSVFLTHARMHGGRTRTRSLRAMRGRGKTREDARSHLSSSLRPPLRHCESIRLPGAGAAYGVSDLRDFQV